MVDREHIKVVKICATFRVFCSRCGLALEPGEQHPCEMRVIDVEREEERELVAA